MLSALRLHQFRCFEQLSLSFSERGGLFLGQNAQGKTSILEAICVLTRLQSPRTSRLQQLVRMGEMGFGLAGEFEEDSRQIRYQPGRGGGLKLKADGEAVKESRNYLASGCLLVWMGNEDLQLIRGGGEARRHFLDFLCGQLDVCYRRELGRYRRALKARNFLLKKEGQGITEQIDAYTDVLIEAGSVIQSQRAQIISSLNQPCADAQAELSSSAGETLGIEYQGSGADDLRSAFDQVRDRELRQGQTVVGPHRDDLVIQINGLPAREFASEGQQRTAALALKLGQGRLLQDRGARLPLYLLDDIFGELDTGRRNALMQFLPAAAQVFVTTTQIDWADESIDWPIYDVDKGAVTRRGQNL